MGCKESNQTNKQTNFNFLLQVHEVNASSSRNGKKILSQLQEATQSHQVSHQGVGTPSKTSISQGASKPKPATMPTAFTNLFKKKDTTTDASKPIDDKKSKKRKRDETEQGRSLRPSDLWWARVIVP